MATRRPASNKEDDVRSILGDEDESEGYTFGDDFDFPVGVEIEGEAAPQRAPSKFLGMSAGERAFLSVILFFNVLIMGAALLFITGRLQF